MTRPTFTVAAAVRGLVVTGLLGAATFTGLGAAYAEPVAPTAGSSAIVGVASDCQVYWPTTYQVCGEIRDFYNSIGGPASSLSFPKGPEVTNPDGSKYSTFLGGTIAWSAATGAYIV
ncbi:LGFP repeat-containing protein [Rhodococcoides fascians]|uniref:LGFP repeat-containing protein n=1 Tax=Rhodococcoides fascians TaxID=1828 RepID=UPI0009B87AC4|nr:hypothetical protein [Rhodococcus fascians]